MTGRINILGAMVDNLSMDETLLQVENAVQSKQQIHHTVVNAGKIVALQENDELSRSVNEADIINADGQSVVWASKILGNPLKERVAGIDLFTNLLSWAHQEGHSVYLLGAEHQVLEELVTTLSKRFSPHLIAGHHHGYFAKEEESEIVKNIDESGAKLLFVAMSSPKKEIFLHRHRKALKKLNFIMGVGGSFDVLAGKTKRAPLWMQKSGLEWFYRFVQEPRRMWKRYLVGNTKFIMLLLQEKFRTGSRLRTVLDHPHS